MDHRFCVAPMMNRTDRHCRYFHRILSKKSFLYTEMIHVNAIIRGETEQLLKYDQKEHPLALQLGGSDPNLLAESCTISDDFGYDEINLNVGCPSSKVQKGEFGAILMKNPNLVANCVNIMSQATKTPITVKCRIGVDNTDEEKHLDRFIEEVSSAGCETFIIHARKAWLEGLSPKDNREIPPLNYERVYRLKESYPDLNLIINGGIKTKEDCLHHLQYVDGVMLGREAYDNPLILTEIDSEIFSKENKCLTRSEILKRITPYIKKELKNGTKLFHITRHLMGLFKGFDGAKNIRKSLISLNGEMNPTDNFEFLLKKVSV